MELKLIEHPKTGVSAVLASSSVLWERTHLVGQTELKSLVKVNLNHGEKRGHF